MHWSNGQSFFCKALHHLAVQLRHRYGLTIDTFELSAELFCPTAICRELDARGSEDFAVTTYCCAGSITSIK